MHIVYRNKEWTVEETCTVKQLLDRLGLLPEAVLVVRNGQCKRCSSNSVLTFISYLQYRKTGQILESARLNSFAQK